MDSPTGLPCLLAGENSRVKPLTIVGTIPQCNKNEIIPHPPGKNIPYKLLIIPLTPHGSSGGRPQGEAADRCIIHSQKQNGV